MDHPNFPDTSQEDNWQQRASKREWIRNIIIKTGIDRYPVKVPCNSVLPPLHMNALERLVEITKELVLFKSFVQASLLPTRRFIKDCTRDLLQNIDRQKLSNSVLQMQIKRNVWIQEDNRGSPNTALQWFVG